MNIIISIIMCITVIILTQSIRIMGVKTERLNFENWLIKNDYIEFLDIYQIYKKYTD